MNAVSTKVLLRFFPPVCRNVFQASPQYDIDHWEWRNILKMAPVCQLLEHWEWRNILKMAPVCQLLLSFVCCMCTGLVTWLNQLSNTVIRCDTTKKVAMEWPPWSFGFMPLPLVALRSGASFVWSMHRVILETEWDVETCKINDKF
jgi:hypothetical protein